MSSLNRKSSYLFYLSLKVDVVLDLGPYFEPPAFDAFEAVPLFVTEALLAEGSRVTFWRSTGSGVIIAGAAVGSYDCFFAFLRLYKALSSTDIFRSYFPYEPF